MDIKITKAKQLKSHPKDESLGFGTIFTDHMLIMKYNGYEDGWSEAEIRPYGKLGLEPASACLHYGQIVWEGMKCYRTDDGLKLFRPYDNFTRLNNSARRMCMPEIDPAFFFKVLKELVKIEKD